ncbi:PIN domain-containing protein [Kineococcus sp. GCM10028916]|uniref:PIN domain-containing protein n=1 Tax=Kineococcus sp. GCM10028916 TaxID=3273394 RepID=UPI003637501C
MNSDAALLIDTNALVDGIVVDGAAISILTTFELAGGIDSTADPAVRAARKRRYDVAASVVDPFPVSGRVLEAYPDIDAAVVAIGRTPRPRRLDLMIAATARAHELPLVTSNLDDYRGLEALLDLRSP